MSAYSDFCESYGGSASDPVFMDNWLNKYASETKSQSAEREKGSYLSGLKIPETTR